MSGRLILVRLATGCGRFGLFVWLGYGWFGLFVWLGYGCAWIFEMCGATDLICRFR